MKVLFEDIIFTNDIVLYWNHQTKERDSVPFKTWIAVLIYRYEASAWTLNTAVNILIHIRQNHRSLFTHQIGHTITHGSTHDPQQRPPSPRHLPRDIDTAELLMAAILVASQTSDSMDIGDGWSMSDWSILAQYTLDPTRISYVQRAVLHCSKWKTHFTQEELLALDERLQPLYEELCGLAL